MPAFGFSGKAAAIATILAITATAAADTFTIRTDDDASRVRFVSKAAMETFDGTTRAVSGRLDLDPAAPGEGLSISVEVEMAALETGIALRDRHMRENHLHTDRFPRATFAGSGVVEGTMDPLPPGEPRRWVIAGVLTIHGVPREAALPLDLTWDGADTLRVESRFAVALADHGIPRPQFLVLKLGEVQQVEVSLTAVRARAEPAAPEGAMSGDEPGASPGGP